MTRTIDWMKRETYPAVAQIEDESFLSPWTEDDVAKTLSSQITIGLVCMERKRVVGYVAYKLHARSVEILRLAVAESARRRGVGTMLAHAILERLTGARRNRAYAYVREDDLEAQLFFKSAGFRCTDIERGAYRFAFRITPAMEAALDAA